MGRSVELKLPIRLKKEVGDSIFRVMVLLSQRRRREALQEIQRMKLSALWLSSEIQHCLIVFISIVLFQAEVAPNHLACSEVLKAADLLIQELGFHPPSVK